MVREVWTFLVLVIFYHYFSSNFILFSSRFFLSQFLTSRRHFCHDFLLRYHLRYHHKYVTAQACAFIKCLGFDKFFDRSMLNVDFENLRGFLTRHYEVFNGMFPKLYAKNCPGIILGWSQKVYDSHPTPSHLIYKQYPF